MAHTLSDLPLEFRPRKAAVTVVLALIIGLEVVFAIGFEFIAKWPVRTFFTRGLVSTLSFLFMIGACVWGLIDLRSRRDRIVIDEAGVLVELNGEERSYRWTEMARFHLVLVHARSKLRMVAIERFGEEGFEAKANVIWPRFGPSTDEFLSLLRAGKARWGAAEPERL
jgi:hypothetical protein